MAVQTTRPKSEMGAGAPRVNQRQSLSSLMRRPETGALIATVSIYIFFVVFAGGAFTDAKGTATWLNPAAELGIIALPVGLLMIAGELDLSVGSVLAASSMTLAIVSG
jgi:simple sugar transport system permease protein